MFLHKYGAQTQETEKRVFLNDSEEEEMTFSGLITSPFKANGIMT
jgi:hypothetical protein